MNGSVGEIIDQQAEIRGSQTFLISPGNEIHVSYAELRQSARETGARLESMGFHKGDKIAFLMNNCPWTVKLFLGVIYSGRVILPLNAPYWLKTNSGTSTARCWMLSHGIFK